MMLSTALTAVFLAGAALPPPAAPRAAPPADAPPAFSDLSYSEALDRSGRDGTTLLIDFTADWCGPCKMMDRDTWADELVVERLDELGVTAIQINADANPALVRRHRANSLPTIVVIKDGKEFDHSRGYLGPTSMLRWAEGLGAGKTRQQILAEASGGRAGKGGVVDIRTSYQLARKLYQTGEFEGATAEFLWLWNNMLDHNPTLVGLRSSSMPREMHELALAYEPAMEVFSKERDEIARRLDEREIRHLRTDWIALSGVVGDTDAVLEWFDSLGGDDRAQALAQYGYQFGDQLVERGRWSDYGMTIGDVKRIVEVYATALRRGAPRSADPAERDALLASYREQTVKAIADAHAGLLAAGREDEAWTLADLATKQINLEQLGRRIVETALDANEPRERHLGLLDENDDEVARRVRAALATGG